MSNIRTERRVKVRNRTPMTMKKALDKLTIHRSFLMRTYPTMKKHNPYTPILIREASNIAPKVTARYGGSNQTGDKEQLN